MSSREQSGTFVPISHPLHDSGRVIMLKDEQSSRQKLFYLNTKMHKLIKRHLVTTGTTTTLLIKKKRKEKLHTQCLVEFSHRDGHTKPQIGAESRRRVEQ